MKRLAQIITYAIFPLGAIVGFVAVELVAPDLPTKVKIFAVLLVGAAIAATWIIPVLLFSFLGDSKRIKTAREALANDDVQTVYDQLHPMTQWVTCNQLDRGNIVLDMLAQMYDRVSLQTSIGEVIRLHRHYLSVYDEAKDSQGIIHDEEISDDLDETFERCRKLAAELPPPPAAT